ncbi:MAG: hypothetical protein LBS83_03785 [Holosporales bacterium]|nr:hypothetical protein [Holosporales bacterium]
MKIHSINLQEKSYISLQKKEKFSSKFMPVVLAEISTILFMILFIPIIVINKYNTIELIFFLFLVIAWIISIIYCLKEDSSYLS